MGKKRDCGGWATRFNIKCADGRTIKPGAFDDMDGKTVPVVWNHNHDSSLNTLGHALLHKRDDGVYADIFFNEDTVQGKNAKALVEHGDITSLSIFANQLSQDSAKNVKHGRICEVSLVHVGANPGAYIEDVSFAHGEDGDVEEAIIYAGEEIEYELEHSDEEDEEVIAHSEEKEKEEMADEKKSSSDDKTIQDVFDTLNEEQKTVVYYMIGQALEEAGKGNSSKEDDEVAKHNVFDNESGEVLRHSMITKEDQRMIIEDANRYGSLKQSFLAHAADMGLDGDDVLMHGTDIEYSEDRQDYMVNDPSFLFPEAKSLNNPPAWIKRDTGWVSGVLSGTKHVPFSRIKSVFADITADEARAKGYIKGDEKLDEVFTLLRRSTDPQTVYKHQSMDRDDVIDITDFDVVAWIKSEMRMMLDEEIARAILIGDGKLTSDRTHIAHDHIRPIWLDDDLFTIKTLVELAANATDDTKAKAYIRAAVKARKNYKGSGNPVFYTTEDVLTDMLLLEDNMGHRLYKSESEVASAMRVSRIVTVQVMEGQKRTVDNVERNLVGIIVNLSDYTVGADKGGAVAMFDDFDIDYNKQKYLIETRCSGALTVPYSAIVIESAVANS